MEISGHHVTDQQASSVVGRMLPFHYLVLPIWQLPAVAQRGWAEHGRTT
jgi:hypothetical protein